MRYVRHMQLRAKMTVSELVEEMKAAGVLGAGRIGKAAEFVTEMFSDPDCTVFLTLAGAMVPAGLRQVICDLVEREYVNVLVTTGANMVHDMVEALGYRHGIGTFAAEDKELKAQKIGRIGDIYVQQEAFEALERWLFKALEVIPEEKKRRLSPAELLHEIGRQIEDSGSILSAAPKKGVPSICPALVG